MAKLSSYDCPEESDMAYARDRRKYCATLERKVRAKVTVGLLCVGGSLAASIDKSGGCHLGHSRADPLRH
jgi:hypothetical protein